MNFIFPIYLEYSSTENVQDVTGKFVFDCLQRINRLTFCFLLILLVVFLLVMFILDQPSTEFSKISLKFAILLWW